MNQKWRILLGICLVLIICVPSVSAAIQFPATQYPLTQSSVNKFTSIKTTSDILENKLTSRDLFDNRAIPFSKRTQKVNLTRISVDSTIPGAFNPAAIFPPMITTDSGVCITKEEAIAKAYSGGVCLTEPITAYLTRYEKPGNPFVKKWVWVVEIRGYIDPEGDDPCGQRDSWTEGDPIKFYIPIGIDVFIDPVTGEILDYPFFE